MPLIGVLTFTIQEVLPFNQTIAVGVAGASVVLGFAIAGDIFVELT